jgi:hypothetical protein
MTGMLLSGSSTFARALHDLGIRFVLVRGDVNRTPRPSFSTQEYALALEHACAAAKCHLIRYGKLTLADFGTDAWLFAFSPSWISDRTSALDAGTALELAANFEPLPRLTIDSSPHATATPTAAFEENIASPQSPVIPLRKVVTGVFDRAQWSARDSIVGIFDNMPSETSLTHGPPAPQNVRMSVRPLITFVRQPDGSGPAWYLFNPSRRAVRGSVALHVQDGASAQQIMLTGTLVLRPGFSPMPECVAARSICSAERSVPTHGAWLEWRAASAAANDHDIEGGTRGATVAILTPQSPEMRTPLLWVGQMAYADDPMVTVNVASFQSKVHFGLYLIGSDGRNAFGCYTDGTLTAHVRDAFEVCARDNGLDIEQPRLEGVEAVESLPTGWPSDLIDARVASVDISGRRLGSVATRIPVSLHIDSSPQAFDIGSRMVFSTAFTSDSGIVDAISPSGVTIHHDNGTSQSLGFDEITDAKTVQRATFQFSAPAYDRVMLRWNNSWALGTVGLSGQSVLSSVPALPFISGHLVIPRGAGPVEASLWSSDPWGAAGDLIAYASQDIRSNTVPLSKAQAQNASSVTLEASRGAGAHGKIDLLRATTLMRGALVVDSPGNGVLVFNQLYDRFWIAVQLNTAHWLLHHESVDGWRNGWFTGAPGRVLIINIVCLVQLLDALLTIIIVTRLIWTGFAKSPSLSQ